MARRQFWTTLVRERRLQQQQQQLIQTQRSGRISEQESGVAEGHGTRIEGQRFTKNDGSSQETRLYPYSSPQASLNLYAQSTQLQIPSGVLIRRTGTRSSASAPKANILSSCLSRTTPTSTSSSFSCSFSSSSRQRHAASSTTAAEIPESARTRDLADLSQTPFVSQSRQHTSGGEIEHLEALLLSDQLGGGQDAQIWVNRLETVLDSPPPHIPSSPSPQIEAGQFQSQSARRQGIAIYGDVLADPKGLITSLLLDPLSEDDGTRTAILERYADRTMGASYVTGEDGRGPAPEDVFVIGNRGRTRAGEGEIATATATESATGFDRELNELRCDTPWLRDAGDGVTLFEINAQTDSSILTTLLTTQVNLIVLDPIRLLDTPLLRDILPSIKKKPNVFFVVNGSLPVVQDHAVLASPIGPSGEGGLASHDALKRIQSVEEIERSRQAVEVRLREQWVSFTCTPEADINSSAETNATPSAVIPKTYFLNSAQAIQALSALSIGLESSGDPTSEEKKTAFHLFQENYEASGLGTFSQGWLEDVRGIMGRLSHFSPLPRVGAGEDVANDERALFLVESAKKYVERRLIELREEANTVLRSAEELENIADRAILSFVVGESEGDDAHRIDSKAVTSSLAKTRSEVQRVLRDRLTWWKVIGWRVDQVGEEVGSEIQARWGFTLTQQLAFMAGRMESTRRELTTTTESTLAQFEPKPTSISLLPHPFYSPLLLNQLEQISARSHISPETLLRPVSSRRDQLLSFSLPNLQRRAYSMTWTTWSLIFASSSLSWSATVPLELISASTGLGVGLLSSMAVLRWAAGRWVRSQNAFWKDWDRIEMGLEDNIKEQVREVMEEKAISGPLEVSKGLKVLVNKQVDWIEKVETDVRDIKVLSKRD